MITPTVGRVVWFWQLRTGHPDEQPLAAIITFVLSGTLVNLTVHDRDGKTYGLTSVTLWHGEGEQPNHPHCEWMPYQKGQAAKVDELEKTIQQGYHDK